MMMMMMMMTMMMMMMMMLMMLMMMKACSLCGPQGGYADFLINTLYKGSSVDLKFLRASRFLRVTKAWARTASALPSQSLLHKPPKSVAKRKESSHPSVRGTVHKRKRAPNLIFFRVRPEYSL
eukprot:2601746-Amphidinium_carterae.1